MSRRASSPAASPLNAYLAAIDAASAPLVVALDAAVRAAHPGFDVAVKYKLLMYALGGDYRTWVCAVNGTPKGACLRFLYGVMLDDPQRVLRAGTSVLKTWDFAVGDEVDAAAVGAYVRQAVERYAAYKADAPAILEASRAAAKAPKAVSRTAAGTGGARRRR
ncbi:MAG: DUF1801 domain-containing protein [Myxococcota bacterium]